MERARGGVGCLCLWAVEASSRRGGAWSQRPGAMVPSPAPRSARVSFRLQDPGSGHTWVPCLRPPGAGERAGGLVHGGWGTSRHHMHESSWTWPVGHMRGAPPRHPTPDFQCPMSCASWSKGPSGFAMQGRWDKDCHRCEPYPCRQELGTLLSPTLQSCISKPPNFWQLLLLAQQLFPVLRARSLEKSLPLARSFFLRVH